MVQQADGANEFLRYLFDVWFLFVEPHGVQAWDCGFCRAKIKSNFTELLPSLIELYKNEQLLNAI